MPRNSRRAARRRQSRPSRPHRSRPRRRCATLPQHKIKRTRISGLWVSVGFFAVVLLLLLIFILQNGTKVDISYMGAHGHLPLGVALLLAAVCGVLLVVLAGAARISQLRTVARRHRRADAKRVTAAQAANGPAGPFAKALPAKDLRDPSCGLVQLVRGVRGVSQNDPGYPRPLTRGGERCRMLAGGVRSTQGERDEQVKLGRDALDAGAGRYSRNARSRVWRRLRCRLRTLWMCCSSSPLAISWVSTSCSSAGLSRSLACLASTRSA